MGGDFDTNSSPYTFKPVTTHDSEDVPELVLSWSGARPWGRDDPDERVIEDVYENTGSLVDTPGEVGGYGDLDTGTPIVDTDGDGMPDDFEQAYGTQPNVADGNGDLDGDGYEPGELSPLGSALVDRPFGAGGSAPPAQGPGETGHASLGGLVVPWGMGLGRVEAPPSRWRACGFVAFTDDEPTPAVGVGCRSMPALRGACV